MKSCGPVLAKYQFTATHTASFVMRYLSAGHFRWGIFALVHFLHAERMTSWVTVSLMLHEFRNFMKWILGWSGPWLKNLYWHKVPFQPLASRHSPATNSPWADLCLFFPIPKRCRGVCLRRENFIQPEFTNSKLFYISDVPCHFIALTDLRFLALLLSPVPSLPMSSRNDSDTPRTCPSSFFFQLWCVAISVSFKQILVVPGKSDKD